QQEQRSELFPLADSGPVGPLFHLDCRQESLLFSPFRDVCHRVDRSCPKPVGTFAGSTASSRCRRPACCVPPPCHSSGLHILCRRPPPSGTLVESTLHVETGLCR